jgi:hypothetical protein
MFNSFSAKLFFHIYINDIFIMAFTRFHDDTARIKKQVEESTFTGRYRLDTPGPGLDLPFLEDPQLRLQGWAANFRTNTVNLESDLLGLTRPLNRDLVDINDYKIHSASSTQPSYTSAEPFVQESRASHPAWMYKDMDHTRWENPFLNPLNGLEKGFHENIQTRILEKDLFTPKIPMVVANEHTDYYLTGGSICIGGKEKVCPGTLYQNRIR